MRAYERLLKYVRIDSTSDEDNASATPSTPRQHELAELLELAAQRAAQDLQEERQNEPQQMEM